MWGCNDDTDGGEVAEQPRRFNPMKKIMSLMLGLSLILGTASFAFGQDTTKDAPKKEGKKKGKKKKEDAPPPKQ
jgi:hypothetical protein